MIDVVSAVPISTGSRLKELMKEKGMTQKELAEICGTHEKTVSQWVNDSCKIRKANIELLAKALDVDAAYLECKQVNKSNGIFWPNMIAGKKQKDCLKNLAECQLSLTI